MNAQRPGMLAAPDPNAGQPVVPFDNYNQDEDEMAYCGPECCAAPGRELWGQKCCTKTGSYVDPHMCTRNLNHNLIGQERI